MIFQPVSPIGPLEIIGKDTSNTLITSLTIRVKDHKKGGEICLKEKLESLAPSRLNKLNQNLRGLSKKLASGSITFPQFQQKSETLIRKSVSSL